MSKRENLGVFGLKVCNILEIYDIIQRKNVQIKNS